MNDEHAEIRSLAELSDQELELELQRRRAARIAGRGMLAAEEAVEVLAHHDSRRTLETMVREHMQRQSSTAPCPKCGQPTGIKAKNRLRSLRTMSGEVTLKRHYHYCEVCQHGFYPLDSELGLSEDGELSPKMSARVLDFGVTTVFSEAAERWDVHHSGVRISENLVRRVVDRAGAALHAKPPCTRHETVRPSPKSAPDTLVVQTDGSMVPMRQKDAWREVKVGVLYREDQHLRGSARQRGMLSGPRYAASLQGIDDFRNDLDYALRAEHSTEANTVAWVGDGAAWNWNLCDELCPNAIEILDFCHMAQHASDCGKAVLGEAGSWVQIWTHSIVERVERGRIDEVLTELHELKVSLRGPPRKAVLELIGYYTRNAERMDYPRYRRLGLPVGSGTVESSHRHLIQARMKLAGQHWSERGAQHMALLRCAYKTAGPRQFPEVALALAA
jgi:hypothetical protein